MAENLGRWAEHRRTDTIDKTSLRNDPSDSAPPCGKGVSARKGEIVEVLDGGIPIDGYVRVKLQLTQHKGWLKLEHLWPCPEGTQNHERLAGEGRTVVRTEICHDDARFAQVQEKITTSVCPGDNVHCLCRNVKVKRLWMLSGQYLGETGMVTGAKETLFHGCKDDVVDAICEDGFDDHFSAFGAFGKGLYFSPQSCKACSYAQNYLLLCEAALGTEENRMTLTARDPSLDYHKVRVVAGKRSVQCHAGAPFNHEERIVYHPTQCKPVYIVEMTEKSKCYGV